HLRRGGATREGAFHPYALLHPQGGSARTRPDRQCRSSIPDGRAAPAQSHLPALSLSARRHRSEERYRRSSALLSHTRSFRAGTNNPRREKAAVYHSIFLTTWIKRRVLRAL